MRSSEPLLVLALLAGVAHADALPCRPTIACTADIVPSAAFELEAGYLYRRLAHHKNQSSGPFLLKLSLGRGFGAMLEGYAFSDASRSARATPESCPP